MFPEMVFGPLELRTLGLIFDEAWEAMSTKHPNLAVEPARLRLASMVLHLARDHQLGPDQIKATALRLLRHDDQPLLASG